MNTKEKKNLGIKIFEVARFAKTDKIIGGGETSGATWQRSSEPCRKENR